MSDDDDYPEVRHSWRPKWLYWWRVARLYVWWRRSKSRLSPSEAWYMARGMAE